MVVSQEDEIWLNLFRKKNDQSDANIPDEPLSLSWLPYQTQPSNRRLEPRAFAPWPKDRPLPCFDPMLDVEPGQNWFDKPVQKKPAREGLFYLKLCKTASSTAAGVHLRIARNLARRRGESWPVCRSRFLHGIAGPKMYRFAQRDLTKSFLWTILREPTNRYVSEYFHFEVSRKSTPVNLRSFQRFLRRGPHADHHSLSWLAIRGYNYQSDKSNPMQTAQTILKSYDFIGLSERFDESVVVLSMLLGIPLRDVLYMSSKQSGGYDGLCFKIQPSKLTLAMKRHLQSAEWQNYVAPEVALWKAVNTSLDLTIDRLGRTKVQANVALFQKVLTAVAQRCTNMTKFPCSSEGEPISPEETDCLVVDMGCGLDCIDGVADAFALE